MGTRNLTKVIDRNGKVVVAQYGQWDGYPAGQGLNALYHSHNASLIEANLHRVHFISNDEAENYNSIIAASEKPIFELFPTLSRDVGADILGYIAYATQDLPLSDNSEFEKDDLFCEAVYTIDLQTKKFSGTWGGKTFSWDLEYLPTRTAFLSKWETE
jgi:hypothetical protein